jgi:pyruvate/2-oxoglutarate dehydrogenase complex dihydrolipoamide acyltransferase (E2) component
MNVRQLSMAEAINEAIRHEMRRDPNIVLLGQDIGSYGGTFGVPAARKLAKDLGIDLAAIKGSGPGGRIVVEDLQRCRKPTKIITSTNAAD